MHVFWKALACKLRTTVRGALAGRSKIVTALGVVAGLIVVLAIAVPAYKGAAKALALLEPSAEGWWTAGGRHLSRDGLYEITSLGAVVWLFFLACVVNIDIFTAHTMDLGQRTKDVEFLQMLPASFGTFFRIKVCERALTDYFSLGVIMPVVVATAVGAAGPWMGLLLGLLSFAAAQLSVSAWLVALQFTLTRFFPLSTIKSIVNLLSLVAMVVFMGLPMLAADYGLLEKIPSDALLSPWFQALPTTWFAGAVTCSGLAPGLALKCLAASLAFAAVCMKVAEWVTERFRHIGWTYLGSAARKGPFPGWRRWFTGYVWKELLMLRRDKNILVNGVLLPVTITGLVLHNWTTVGLVKGSSFASILAIVSGGLLYFHLFGATNAVGIEGRAIGLLAMIPLSPTRFLATKASIWAVLGALLFETFFFGYVAVALPSPPPLASLALGGLWLAFLSFLLAALGVGLSLHFVNYEAKFLQQASTLPGKLVMLLFSVRAVYVLAMKNWMPAATTLVFIALFAATLLYKASRQLTHPHESDLPDAPGDALSDALLMIFIMGLVNPVAALTINAIVFEYGEGLTSLLCALALVDTVVVVATWRHFRRRHGAFLDGLGLRPTVVGVAAGAGAGAALAFWVRSYLDVLPQLGVNLPSANMQPSQVYLFLAVVCGLVPMCEEFLIRGLVHRGLQRVLGPGRRAVLASAFFFALLHPTVSVPPVYMLGIGLAVLYDKTRCLPACVVMHVVYNLLVTWPQVAPTLYY